ncbi:MAG: dsRBD fold-containing protein [Nakamurella sp.]
MTVVHRWQVEIFIDDHETRTRAEARLHSLDRTSLVGVGVADHAAAGVPEIAEELAVSRALVDLAARLLDSASGEADGDDAATGTPAEIGAG